MIFAPVSTSPTPFVIALLLGIAGVFIIAAYYISKND